ncbi:N-acetylglucosamine-6-phosphate deacetylase [Ignatzschineria sp. LJL83]
MNQEKLAYVAPVIFDGETLHRNRAILVDHQQITAIVAKHQIPTDYKIVEIKGTILPGFLDLQVNGGGGVLFNDQPNIEGLKTIIQAHQNLGTSAILPTLITADDQTISKGLHAVQKGIEQNLSGLLGIHIEGPMINPERKGIHKLSNIRILSDTLIDEICAHQEFTRLITLAPEMVSLKLIEKLSNTGVIVFAGHTEASPERLQEAVLAGLQGFTHLYNAMPQMESRNPSTTGFAIQSKETFTSIIHDTFHVDPLMVKLAYQSKPKGTLFLVSDAMSSIGSDQEQFILDDQTIYVQEGKLTNATGTLAGAHVDMATSVLNSISYLDISESEAFTMGTSIPATVIHSQQYGFLKPGFKAFLNQYHNNKIRPICY